MRTITLKILSSLLALVMFTVQAVAFSIPSEFAVSEEETALVSAFDESEIYNAFGEVEALVMQVQEREGVTYSVLEAENNALIANLSATSFSMSGYDRPPIFSAFMWGCLLNLLGMMIVALTTGFEGSQMMKSGWGCLINSLLWGVSYWGYFSYSYY